MAQRSTDLQRSDPVSLALLSLITLFSFTESKDKKMDIKNKNMPGGMENMTLIHFANKEKYTFLINEMSSFFKISLLFGKSI